MPINRPLAPKITVEPNIIRIRVTTIEACSCENPGAKNCCVSHGANNPEMPAKAVDTINSQLMTALASFQASVLLSLASKVVKVGMKADPRAPPAITWNIKSGTLNAVK